MPPIAGVAALRASRTHLKVRSLRCSDEAFALDGLRAIETSDGWLAGASPPPSVSERLTAS